MAEKSSGWSRPFSSDETGSTSPAVPAGATAMPSLESLSQLLLEAASAQIVGVIPREFMEALQTYAEETEPKSRPDDLSFITPELAYIGADDNSTNAIRVRNSWQGGITGLSNLIAGIDGRSARKPGAEVAGFVKSIPLGLTDCVLRLDDRHFLLHSLPRHWKDKRADYVLVAEHDSSCASEVRDWVKSWDADLRPVSLREVLCNRLPAGPPIEEHPRLEIRDISPFGNPVDRKGSLLPIAAVIARYRRGNDPHVVLKRRSRFLNANDFDLLSILTARLQDEDLFMALPEEKRAGLVAGDLGFDDYFKLFDSPSPFTVPPEAFMHAAQREAEFSLGIEDATGRLTYQGFARIERTPDDYQLGFAVFTIDLDTARSRRDGLSEVDVATQIGQNFEILSEDQFVAQLEDNPTNFNHLLRKESKWLRPLLFPRAR